MDDPAARLRGLPARFRDILGAPNTQAAGVRLFEASVFAAKVVQAALELGLITWHHEINFPRRKSDSLWYEDSPELWAIVWNCIAGAVALEDDAPSNPNTMKLTKVAEGVSVGDMHDPDQWAMRAERYALVAEWLAGRLPSPQVLTPAMPVEPPATPDIAQPESCNVTAKLPANDATQSDTQSDSGKKPRAMSDETLLRLTVCGKRYIKESKVDKSATKKDVIELVAGEKKWKASTLIRASNERPDLFKEATPKRQTVNRPK